jgi:hypothetical protein
VNPSRVSIRIPNGCCTFQPSLVYNRVCWDSFDGLRTF